MASPGRPKGQPKTGGRQPGTPNRQTVEVIERLIELKCDPIEGMAKLALDEANTPELRGRMYGELANYVYPKRKAMEFVPGKGGSTGFSLLELLATMREHAK